MSKKTKVKPNYERMREPYVHALQVAYKNYGRAQSDWYDFTGFMDDGTFYFINKESLTRRIDESAEQLTKAMQDLQDFDAWVRVEKQNEIV